MQLFPLKASRCNAIANLKWHQRPNFDGYVYIHYTAPPYSARISTIYFLPFGNVWLGSACRLQRVPTKHNAEFMEGGWELRSRFKPIVDQSSRNFQTM